MIGARTRLERAHKARAAADVALDAVSHAAGSARAFASDIQAEVEKHAEVDRGISAARGGT